MVTFSVAGTTAAVAQKVATTTSLAVSSASGPVTSVSYGTAVTLTATVTPASGVLAAGQVNFCDGAAAHCTDIHILGTAQITSAGKASIKLRLAPGSRSFKAQFAGSNGFAVSTSAASALTITGRYPSSTSLTQTGGPGNYQLTATVSGSNKVALGPGGNVSFVDSTAGNQVLATVGLGNATTSILSNVSNPAVGTNPSRSVAGDFDGDGIQDLAVATSSGTTVLSILLGDGTGNFTPAAGSPVSSVGSPWAVSDFNADGYLDILATGSNGLLAVLLGKGDGTFIDAPGTPFTSVYAIQPAIVADFNGDGIPDIAAAGGYYLTVFLGKGDGSFNQLPISSSTISQTNLFGSMAAGDFNGDGNQDMAVTNGADDSITIFAGKGDGTFNAGAVALAATSSGNAYGVLSAADLNGDGVLDLAAPFSASGDQIVVLLGGGDGSFHQASGTTLSLSYMNKVLVGDFNGDGIPDLLAAAQTNIVNYVVALGNGDGTYSVAPTGSLLLPCCSNTFVNDFNGDGLTDVVSSAVYDGTVQLLFAGVAQATAVANNINSIGPGTDQVSAKYPGDTNYTASSSASIALQSRVSTPVLSPPPGVYSTVQTITIADSSPGATIYYTLSSDSSSSTHTYTGPFTLSTPGSQYITVYASVPGSFDSSYVQAGYILVLPPAPTPTISLASGSYSGSQTVTLSDSLAGAQIYYTTDGSVPYNTSTLYSGPITISSSETLSAVAYAAGYSPGQRAAAQYIIASSSVPLIYTVAGIGTVGYTGDGGAATLAELEVPYAAIKDAAGNIYIADQSNHAVRKVAAGTGVISTFAGSAIPGYSGDGGPATSAKLSWPYALALDSAGNLFIVDLNGTVRLVDHATGNISTYAGNPTATSYGSSPAPATDVSLIGTYGIAIDSSRNVYLSTNSKILVVNDSTRIISTLAGSGVYVNGQIGDGGPASGAFLSNARALVFDSGGNLYIADIGNHRIRKIAATNGVVTPSSIIASVAGSQYGTPYSEADGPATSIYLYLPAGLAIDAANNLLISDSNTNLLWKVNATTQIMSRVAGHYASCLPYSNSDGGAASSATLCQPSGISIDSSGNLLIAETSAHRIREIVTTGAPPSTQAATPVISPASGTYTTPQTITVTDSTPGASIYVSFDNSAPTALNYGYSFPITVTGAMTIRAFAVAPGYLASTPASASYTVTASEPVISTIAGTGTSGSSYYLGSFAALGSGGPALNAAFGRPTGLAVDKSGNVYFSDYNNNAIWKIDPSDGTATVVAGNGQSGTFSEGAIATNITLRSVSGIAVDNAGNLYIADFGGYAIRKVNANTGIITTVAGTGLYPQSSVTGDGGPATSAAMTPNSVALDSAGNIYIGDISNNKPSIRKVLAQSGIITTIAGNGTSGYSGDGGLATQASISGPAAIVTNSAGDIYFVSGSLIRKVTAATGIISTIAGTYDAFGEKGDGGPATSAQINPFNLALDAAENLYITNAAGAIRKVDLSTGIISRVAGVGFAGFSGDGGPALAARMNDPYGLAFDPAGNLIFADYNNSRIRKISFAVQTAATPTINPVTGTYSSAQTVTISDTTPGATIYYTTDGSTPTTASTVYSAPFIVSATQTVKAIATAANFNTSAVAGAVITIVVPSPSPAISSLSPAVATAGGASFTLTVNGSSFVATSVIYWGSTALTTQYVSASQLTAQVPAASIAAAGIATVTVQTPAPSGGTSNSLKLEIDPAGSTPPAFNPTSATVTAGTTATYGVTLPSGATNVSVTCLNLPANATCSYTASPSALTITTTSSTPAGTYVITAVFTETLPGAATALVLLPFLLAPFGAAKRKTARFLHLAIIGLVVAVVAAGSGCGGGGGGGSTSQPQTHQATSSATVTLVVK
jgi:sugar lactone lactonase YvrE